ncbi:hypothetical protein BH09MYX1_BH09MYX1_39180 [soil metagenome]
MHNGLSRRRWEYVLLGLLGTFGACTCGGDQGTILDAGGDRSADASSEDPTLGDATSDVVPPLSGCEMAQRTGDPVGCTYLAFSPELSEVPTYGCIALLVSNPGKLAARLKVTWKGIALDVEKHGRLVSSPGLPYAYQPMVNGTLPPGTSGVIALIQGFEDSFHPYLKCSFPAAFTGDFEVYQGQRGSAFRVDATEPVFLSSVSPYSAGLEEPAGGMSFRAESNWETRYLDVGTYKPGRPDLFDGGIAEEDYWWSLQSHPSYTTLTATRAATVKIARDGGTATYNLAPNEVVAIRRDDQFIGSLIQSDSPLAVGTGNPTLRVPFDAPFVYGAQPSFHWMAPPASWGSEVAAVRYPRRYPSIDEPGVWRILGGADGTTLTYDPAPPPGAPLSLTQGEQAVFDAAGPFVVRSQDEKHPFHVSLLMTVFTTLCSGNGSSCTADRRGNPELVAILPPQEYARRFSFLTDPSFSETRLVVTRRRDGGTFHDVALDCAGTLSDWKPIGIGGLYETTYVALSSGNFAPQTYPGGTCTLGPHTLESDGPVALTLWGWGSSAATAQESYGGTSYAINVFGLGPRPARPVVPQN